MKKENRNIYVNLLIIVLLISMFVLSVEMVSAANIFDPVRDLFTFNFGQDISTPLAQWLFLILLTLLIWSIINTGNLFKSDDTIGKFIAWVVSFITAFLGVAYLTPNEVWTTLTSYSALAITLLFFFPFAILALFTWRISQSGTSTGVVGQYVLWIIYFLVLISRFVTGMVGGRIKVGETSTWIFIAALVITGLAIIGNRYIIKKLAKWGDEAAIDLYKRQRKAYGITHKEALKELQGKP